MQLLEKARNLFLSAPDEAREASRNAMKLRRHVNEANEKENIEMVCSNRDAVHAYLEPLVDTSSEKFRWRQMNIPLVRQILHQRLNWPDKSQIHEENNSFAAFEKWNSFLELGGHSQRRLDGFFSAKLLDKPLEFVFTKKMVEALEKIQRKRTGVTVPVATDSDIVVEKVKPSPKKRSKTIASGRGRGRGRGRRGNARGGGKSKPQNDLNLSEESSSSYSDDSFDDV
uniref:Uncharacterized protein n=1 Tax=Caenorhabditis japonica TaxID=281687 RepID=A0A8R1IKE6_CAEJA